MGVRKDGRLLTDQEGGGAPVDIVSPIGPQPMADSVSVTIASDQTPIPVDIGAVGTLDVDVVASVLPTGASTEATLAAINGKLNSLGQKPSATSVPVVLASDQPAIPVNATIIGTVAVTQPVTVDQGTPNSIANGWPILVTDGSINANVNVINNGPGLVIDTGGRDGASFNSLFTPLNVIAGRLPGLETLIVPHVTQNAVGTTVAGLVVRPAQLPSNESNSGIIAGISQGVALSTQHGFGQYTIEILGTFVGTLSVFQTGDFGETSSVKIYDTTTNEWVSEIVLNGSVNKYLIVKVIGFASLTVFCTAYTSGSVDVFLLSSVADMQLGAPPLAKIVDEDTDYEVDDVDSLTQTTEGRLRTQTAGLVSDVPESYIPGTNHPLSLTTDGRLRVSSVDSLLGQVWQNTFNNPWDSQPLPQRLSAWD